MRERGKEDQTIANSQAFFYTHARKTNHAHPIRTWTSRACTLPGIPAERRNLWLLSRARLRNFRL
jgi:hypothetical protein